MFYADNPLDRRDQHRRDPAAIEDYWQQSDTRVVLLWQDQVLVTNANADSAPRCIKVSAQGHPDALPRTYLGHHDGHAWFSVDYSTQPSPALPADTGVDPDYHPERHEFADLRVAGPHLPRDEGAILAYARALSWWQRHSRFCSRCGHDTTLINAGHVRRCNNETCKTDDFPRTDPAVIMLIADTDNQRCLLGRSPGWPEGVLSTLAGFVEPGETLEAAVRREVYEEAGVHVGKVDYLTSQPWPFPRSIMLGFVGHATTTELTIDPTELASAGWYTRQELRTFGNWGDDGPGHKLPRPDSIARHLINEWIG